MEDVAIELVKQGVLGAIVVALASYVLVLQKEVKKARAEQLATEKAHAVEVRKLQEAHQQAIAAEKDKRIEDFKKTGAQMLETNDKTAATLHTVASAMELNRQTMGEFRETIRDLVKRGV